MVENCFRDAPFCDAWESLPSSEIISTRGRGNRPTSAPCESSLFLASFSFLVGCEGVELAFRIATRNQLPLGSLEELVLKADVVETTNPGPKKKTKGG